MPEQVIEQQQEQPTTVIEPNQLESLGNNMWNLDDIKPPVIENNGDNNIIPPTNEAPAPPIIEVPKVSEFDPNSFVKENFGFDTVELAKEGFQQLKEKKPEIQFENEESRTVYEYIAQGKMDELNKFLSTQDKLNVLTNSEVTTSTATEIMKFHIQSKNTDLTPDEVDFLIQERFALPHKPTQGLDQTEEEYLQAVISWQAQVENINKRLIIEAKQVKPELATIKANLKLSPLQIQPIVNEPTQEELQKVENNRKMYVERLNSDYQSFKGFDTAFKDEVVELPVSYSVSDDEKVSLKQRFEDFDSDMFLSKRWITEAGEPNVQQMMADVYLLENVGKIFQKIANDAGNQRLEHHLQKASNISVNGKQSNQSFDPNGVQNQQQTLANNIWNT